VRETAELAGLAEIAEFGRVGKSASWLPQVPKCGRPVAPLQPPDTGPAAFMGSLPKIAWMREYPYNMDR
jgi:hypothetical protein